MNFAKVLLIQITFISDCTSVYIQLYDGFEHDLMIQVVYPRNRIEFTILRT
jgi:hypothetical protein